MWKVGNPDIDRIKYGLIWPSFDMGSGNWYKADCPRYVLDSNTRIQFDRWILGGFTGKDFLISPVDLPRRPGKGSKTIRMYEQVGLEGLNKIQSTPRNILCAFGPVLRTVKSQSKKKEKKRSSLTIMKEAQN